LKGLSILGLTINRYCLSHDSQESQQKGEELKKEKPVGLRKLGIDEIALEKGKKNYCAVLVNIETRELLGILEKRSKEELMKYLKEWDEDVLLGIEEVSIDMWKP
jgi:transposase